MSEVLRLENVCKSFGHRPVVKNVSFAVGEGEIFGFLGPNGAGKTTTIKMVLGLLAADSGTILVNGHDIENDFEAAMSGISGIVENPDMYGYLSGYDNLMIQARACGADPRRIDEVVTLVGMQMRIKEKFKSYSLGMKQRLAIALAVMHNPSILILDEPINGLDPIGIAEVRSFIRELCDAQGKTILISSHILSEIALLADDIGIIDHGVLLVEESLTELENKNRHYIQFGVSDSKTAARILQNDLRIQNFKVCDQHILQVMDVNVPIALINRTFIQNGLEVSEAHMCEDTLEDYFKQVTGGEGIA